MKLKRSTAKDYIRERPELILQPDRNGGFICPICGSGSGKNGTGLFVQRDKMHYTCFAGSCFKNKDIFDIIGLQYGLTDFKDIMSKAAELTGIELLPDGSRAPEDFADACKPKTTPPRAAREYPDYTKFFHIAHRDIDKTDYWKRRGFTRETMSRFKIGYSEQFSVNKDTGETWKALIIPVTAHAYTVRNTDPGAAHDHRHRKRGNGQHLYNPLKIDLASPGRAVFIVEGELDALSVIQAGGAAIALRSVSNTGILIEKLEQARPRAILGLLDNDERGKAAEQQIIEALKESGTEFTPCNFTPYHDPNDLLQHDPDTLSKFIASINRAYERIYNK